MLFNPLYRISHVVDKYSFHSRRWPKATGPILWRLYTTIFRSEIRPTKVGKRLRKQHYTRIKLKTNTSYDSYVFKNRSLHCIGKIKTHFGLFVGYLLAKRSGVEKKRKVCRLHQLNIMLNSLLSNEFNFMHEPFLISDL